MVAPLRMIMDPYLNKKSRPAIRIDPIGVTRRTLFLSQIALKR